MQAADCRPDTKCRLGTKCGLQTAVWVQNADWESKEFFWLICDNFAHELVCAMSIYFTNIIKVDVDINEMSLLNIQHTQ